MSAIQQVECPKCHLALKPATPLPAGTLVKCPRCSLQFTTPGPAPAALPPLAGVPAPPQAAVATRPAPAKNDVPVASFAHAPPNQPDQPRQPNRMVVLGIVLLGGTGLLATMA